MDLAPLRDKLQKDLAETDRTLAVIRERLTVPQVDSGGEIGLADQHPADAATETESRELDMTRQRMLEARVSRIGEALARMESGAYGKCVVCGEQIPEERLAAVPETPYCVRDAAREERR
ncbi:MAG: TraR/DksA C4-type zinc finger protein [Candidatus Limnocylindria bacterium]